MTVPVERPVRSGATESRIITKQEEEGPGQRVKGGVDNLRRELGKFEKKTPRFSTGSR